MSLMTPFLAYLPAEQLGGSGVLAAVAAGLYVSQAHSRYVRATTRLEVLAIWRIVEFVLDGLLFLVAGMQYHRIIEPLSRVDKRLLWSYGIGVSLLVILLRIIWVFATSAALRAEGEALRCEQPRPSWKRLFIVSWSGMRGAVSLAAALSIPLTTSLGAPFPARDLIIFLTFCVIVSTLLLQGMTLGPLIRALGIDREGRHERSEDGHREIEARLKATQESLKRIANHREKGAFPESLLSRLEEQYLERHSQFRAHLAGDHAGAAQRGAHRLQVQLDLIEAERRAILELRDEGKIDDWTHRRIEQDLDLQEMRLQQGVWEHAVPGEDGDSSS
jgi:CPA1 family monovalent cation:H+ antiporter